MRKTKEQRGITLIALIITIIVLLILAVVAIGAVQNDGIINYAKNARQEYGEAQDKENSTLGNYLEKLNQNAGSGNGGSSNGGDANSTPATTIAEAHTKDDMLTRTENTDLTDKYTNKITVPAGFKILVDDTTGYTSETIDVTKGIVITDGTNEFVWVPVGEKIYKNETEFETINLDRYTFALDGTPTPKGKEAIDAYYQELETSTTHGIAKDLQGFIKNAISKGGYYLARYEAGVINYNANNITDNTNEEENWTGYIAENGKKLQLVSRKNVQVWNLVTQNKASELSRNMYTSNNFTSDLVNSYAWDTAIIFIQKFSTEADASNYANLNKSTNFGNTGTNTDKYCNIYDMSGNARELSTEYYGGPGGASCCIRGGEFYASGPWIDGATWNRIDTTPTFYRLYTTFRPILYINN